MSITDGTGNVCVCSRHQYCTNGEVNNANLLL